MLEEIHTHMGGSLVVGLRQGRGIFPLSLPLDLSPSRAGQHIGQCISSNHPCPPLRRRHHPTSVPLFSGPRGWSPANSSSFFLCLFFAPQSSSTLGSYSAKCRLSGLCIPRCVVRPGQWLLHDRLHIEPTCCMEPRASRSSIINNACTHALLSASSARTGVHLCRGVHPL